MQAMIYRQTLALRAPITRASKKSCRFQRQNASRSYAEPGDTTRSVKPSATGQKDSKAPLFAIGAVVAAIPLYYFFHSNKPPRDGQATIEEKRRRGDPSKEFRDPRDSDVKTLEQKKAKEGR